METDSSSGTLQERRREVLRQAGAALQGRVVTLWEVSPRAVVVPVLTSVGDPPYHAILDVEATLRRWGTPIVRGKRWLGCHLDDPGMWVIAPVRVRSAAPPPGGIERRRGERLTLELAALCLALIDRVSATHRPRLPEPDALVELTRQPSVIAHEVANPLTAASVSLELCADSVRAAGQVDPPFRAQLLEELAHVAAGIEHAFAFLRSVQDRARAAPARSERFDATQVVRSCVTLERPLARKSGVALHDEISAASVFLQGDPNRLYQVVTNLIRNAVAASGGHKTPVVVGLDRRDDVVRLTVQDQGIGIAAEHLEQIFQPGFTMWDFRPGSGTGLTVVRHICQEMFGGEVHVKSAVGLGSIFTATFPIPPQRSASAEASR